MSYPDQPAGSPADPRPSDSENSDWADRTQVLPPGAFGAAAQSPLPETDLSAPAAAPPAGSESPGGYAGASTGGGWSPASGSSPYSAATSGSAPDPAANPDVQRRESPRYEPPSAEEAGPTFAAPAQPSSPGARPEPSPSYSEPPRQAYPIASSEPDPDPTYVEPRQQTYPAPRAEPESAPRYSEPPRQPYPAGGPTEAISPDYSSRAQVSPADSDATVSYPAGLLASAAEPKPPTAPQPVGSIGPAGTPYGTAGYGAPPAYAPAGPEPANYQPPFPPGPGASAGQNAVQPEPTRPAAPASRAPIAAILAVIGIILVGAGVFLGARYGYNFTLSQHLSTRDKILSALGGLLIFVAIVLNGWSFWATLIPGIVLTAAGAWAAVSVAGAGHLRSWLRFALPAPDLSGWRLLAWTGVLGVMLLGSSIATAIARGGGRRFGVRATKATQPAPQSSAYSAGTNTNRY